MNRVNTFIVAGSSLYCAPRPGGATEERVAWEVAQAFSHFTYSNSSRTEMVVDIQGVGRWFTDPQLHSSVENLK